MSSTDNRAPIDQMIHDIVNKTNAETEYLCAAFLKHTGLTPDQCEICTQTNMDGARIWIRKREVLPIDEIEELKKDRERLEWLIKNEKRVELYEGRYDVFPCGQMFHYKTPRLAIDAAMKESGK